MLMTALNQNAILSYIKRVVLDCFFIHFNRPRKVLFLFFICTLFKSVFCSVLKIICFKGV